MARCKNRRGNQERGFALLLVFLMASIVAIMLYMELPRAAMQAQRDKEETLIDRGEQYKRAISFLSTRRGVIRRISKIWRIFRISASCANATRTR